MKKNCGMSVDQHIEQISKALMESGAGGACEGTYQAIVELAAVMKALHGFDAYTPVKTAEILAETEAAKLEMSRPLSKFNPKDYN